MNLSAYLGSGRVVMNDYTLLIGDIPGGHRLTVRRGNEESTLDVMDGQLGRGISGARLTDESALELTFTDGSVFVTPSIRGPQGAPGTTAWAGIEDKPLAFPPQAHSHAPSDVTGLEALLAAAEAPVMVTQLAQIAPSQGETVSVTGQPAQLHVSLPAPQSGRDYLVSVIFRAGAGFQLTHTLPAQDRLNWASLPDWQAGALYELSYRCLWQEEDGQTVIAARWESFV